MDGFIPQTGASPAQIESFVAPNGNDTNPGTIDKPFATPHAALDAAQKMKQKACEEWAGQMREMLQQKPGLRWEPWHSMGYFHNIAFDEPVGPEENIRMINLGQKFHEVAWVKQNWPDGQVNMFPKKPDSALDSVMYIYRTVYSEKDQKIQLSLGGGNGLKLWVNGKAAYSISLRFSSTRPDQFRTAIDLHKGRNEIVLKIFDKAGSGGFYFQNIRDIDFLPEWVLDALKAPPVDQAFQSILRDYYVSHIWNKPVTVYLRGGTYYFGRPLSFTSDDSCPTKAPLTFSAYEGEEPVFSGAVKLNLNWSEYKNGIMQADVPAVKRNGLRFTQLFVDGKCQHLARYPNFSGDYQYNGPGSTTDENIRERARTWTNPVGGFVHGLQDLLWGSLHYRISGVDENGNLQLEGGDQLNRGDTPPNKLSRQGIFVENVFEELDAPGEWFLDADKGILYFMPPEGMDVEKADVEAVVLKQLVEFAGSMEKPVRNIHLKGIRITHTMHTYLNGYEPLLRGDWSINRAAAVFIEGTEDCSVQDCFFDAVGGNGVFISNYNRRAKVTGCKFTEAGDNAICLVGNMDAVRNPSTPVDQVGEPPDKAIGPKTQNYPAACLIHDNLIHHIGLIGKQVAGVFMSMTADNIISHNTIYHIPRAAICINDGCWGGQVIEYNDCFDTVRETGDHGPFNCWGRDRFIYKAWSKQHNRNLCLSDNYKPTIIRHNRFAHYGSFSWGIDLMMALRIIISTTIFVWG